MHTDGKIIAKVKDLTGQKFGHLTVVERLPDFVSPNTGKRVARWDCICDCKSVNPNHKAVNHYNLLKGRTTNCGCISGKRQLEDFTGRIIEGISGGKLQVIERAENFIRSDGAGEPQWRCKCLLCGNENIIVRAIYLRQNCASSCTCINKQGRSIINPVQPHMQPPQIVTPTLKPAIYFEDTSGTYIEEEWSNKF